MCVFIEARVFFFFVWEKSVKFCIESSSWEYNKLLEHDITLLPNCTEVWVNTRYVFNQSPLILQLIP